MKICIPTATDSGVNSTVSGHFGSAPFFMIVDTDSSETKTIVNTNQHHAHGMCQPLAVLGSEQFDGIVVGGIGAGALNRLRAANIKVFKTGFKTVLETVNAFKAKTLLEVNPQGACGGHGHHGDQGGCHHHG